MCPGVVEEPSAGDQVALGQVGQALMANEPVPNLIAVAQRAALDRAVHALAPICHEDTSGRGSVLAAFRGRVRRLSHRR